MQLIKVTVLTCEHAKTVLSAKDFVTHPHQSQFDVILACFKCGEWTPVEFK